MSDLIHSSLKNLFIMMRHAAIAVCTGDGTQLHVGIFHKNSDTNEVHILHLAWHHILMNQQPKDKYIWVDPNINPHRLRQVAAACRKIWRANPDGIPYAFSSPEASIDEQTGEFLIGPTKLGLTCASFVLAVFHSVGLPLIEYNTWPTQREGDDEWQHSIISSLKECDPPASPEHISAIKDEVGSVRYRPHEVAGASITDAIPAPFEDASLQSTQILITLSEC